MTRGFARMLALSGDFRRKTLRNNGERARSLLGGREALPRPAGAAEEH